MSVVVSPERTPDPSSSMMASEDATKRLSSKKQTLDDAYAAPANFLEIDVINPITHGVANKRYTDYEVRMKVSAYCEYKKQATLGYMYNRNLLLLSNLIWPNILTKFAELAVNINIYLGSSSLGGADTTFLISNEAPGTGSCSRCARLLYDLTRLLPDELAGVPREGVQCEAEVQRL